MRLWFVALTAAFMAIACDGDDPTESVPGTTPDRLAILGTDAGEILIVDPGAEYPDEQPVGERIPIPRFREAFAVSADGATAYFTAFDQLPARRLLSFDLTTRRLVGNRAIGDLLGSEDAQDVIESGGEALAVSPDGSRLLVAGWRSSGGEMGVGVLDAQTFEPVGFVGPLLVGRGGLTTLPPSQDYPAGAVIALGRRAEEDGPDGAYLYVLGPNAFQVVDSLPGAVEDVRPHQLLAAPDGNHVYVSGPYTLARYDLTARSITEQATLPGVGWLSIARDGQEIFRTDQAVDSVTVSPGRVFVFGPDLEERKTVDGILTNHVVYAAQGGNPDLLYVVGGTARAGFGDVFERARLYVIDRRGHGSVERIIELEAWGPGPVIPLP